MEQNIKRPDKAVACVQTSPISFVGDVCTQANDCQEYDKNKPKAEKDIILSVEILVNAIQLFRAK